MRLEFHKQVASDISRIMEYYESVVGPELAMSSMPSFKFICRRRQTAQTYGVRERDLRRVNLNRFPYHFLFRIVEDHVRVLVVRHHKRRPSLGVHRR